MQLADIKKLRQKFETLLQTSITFHQQKVKQGVPKRSPRQLIEESKLLADTMKLKQELDMHKSLSVTNDELSRPDLSKSIQLQGSAVQSQKPQQIVWKEMPVSPFANSKQSRVVVKYEPEKESSDDKQRFFKPKSMSSVVRQSQKDIEQEEREIESLRKSIAESTNAVKKIDREHELDLQKVVEKSLARSQRIQETENQIQQLNAEQIIKRSVAREIEQQTDESYVRQQAIRRSIYISPLPRYDQVLGSLSGLSRDAVM